jgi:hypothetical protein
VLVCYVEQPTRVTFETRLKAHLRDPGHGFAAASRELDAMANHAIDSWQADHHDVVVYMLQRPNRHALAPLMKMRLDQQVFEFKDTIQLEALKCRQYIRCAPLLAHLRREAPQLEWTLYFEAIVDRDDLHTMPTQVEGLYNGMRVHIPTGAQQRALDTLTAHHVHVVR